MDVIRFFRCEFWVVSVFPAWVGWCLATRQLAPGIETIAELLQPRTPVNAIAWLSAHRRAVLALVTLGPFLGGSIMVTNDYFDRAVDAFNPKKTRSPLVCGTATPQRALAWMVLLSAATLVGGWIVSPTFALLLLIGLAMSFAYSAPPIRLKARPLGDVLINAIGYGVLTAFAGWSLGSGGSGAVPVGGFLIVALAIAAGYIPAVMMDREADARSGLRTTAVVYGHGVSWRLGLLAVLGANATMLGLALLGLYVAPAFAWVVVAFLALELSAYVLLVRSHEQEQMFLGGSIVTLAFFGNLVSFLVAYVG